MHLSIFMGSVSVALEFCGHWPSTKHTKASTTCVLLWMHDIDTLVASLMSLPASLVTTSRMQQCFNVLADIYHELLLLFHCCIFLEIKLTTTRYLLKMMHEIQRLMFYVVAAYQLTFQLSQWHFICGIVFRSSNYMFISVHWILYSEII